MPDDTGLYARMCGNKIPHKSRAEAKRHADELNAREGRAVMKDYLCFFCNHWHVGLEIRVRVRKKK